MGLLDKGYIWRSMSLCVVLALPAQKKKRWFELSSSKLFLKINLKSWYRHIRIKLRDK
jgi:hypothetical protein